MVHPFVCKPSQINLLCYMNENTHKNEGNVLTTSAGQRTVYDIVINGKI